MVVDRMIRTSATVRVAALSRTLPALRRDMPTVLEPTTDAGDIVAVRTTFRRDAARAAVVSRPALFERLARRRA